MRNVYVLMYTDRNTGRDMFATVINKRIALRHAKRLSATVYAIPYPGSGWDCPTIRTTFDPIYRPEV